MGKAVLKKSVAKTARPAAGKAPVKAAPAKSESKSGSAGKSAVPARPAAKSAPAGKAVASGKPAAAVKSAPSGKSAPVAVAKKAVPAVVTKGSPNSRVNGSHKSTKPETKSRIETKPDRPEVKAAPRVEQVSSSGDSKPKKNQAGMSPKELEHFRDLLLAKRRELVGDMKSMELEALQSGDAGLSTLPIHMADMGTDNYEQEFTLGLVEKDRNLLREINHALAKIQNGMYGICEGNGKPIAKVRLEAQPWARFSIEFARMQERGGIR